MSKKSPGYVVDTDGIIHMRTYFRAPTTKCGRVMEADALQRTTNNTVTCMACAVAAYSLSDLNT